MPDIGPQFSTSDEALFGMVVFFLVNVIINLFLIRKIFAERQRNRQLTRERADPGKAAQQFLDDQLERTRSYNRSLSETFKLEKQVVYLRAAYLKIESAALNHKLNTTAYWEYLNEHLVKLLKAIAPQLVHKDAEIKDLQSKISTLKDKIAVMPGKSSDPRIAQKKEKILSLLDGFAQQHLHSGGDKARLKKQVEKIEHAVKLFEDPQLRKKYTLQKRQRTYLKNSQRHLNTLRDNHSINEANIQSFQESLSRSTNVALLEQELSKFRGENNKLNEHVEQLKKELKEFQQRLSAEDTPTPFVEGAEKKAADRDMIDLSDEILQANEREIDRLHHVIANQRKSILEMEESIQQLEVMTESESSGHKSEIDKLRRCIQESEICIGMLEKELEELKNDLQSLRNNREEAGLTLAETSQLAEELTAIKSELEKAMDHNHRNDALVDFVKEALNASSIEDISLLIYENISSLNYLPSVILKGPERTIELAPQNSLSVRDKVLINNMQINEINPGSSGQLSFRFLNVAGIVRPPEGAELRGDDQVHILEIMKISDKVIHHLAANQKIKMSTKHLDTTVGAIKQTSYEMDKLLDDYTKKTRKLISNNFGQLQDMARAKGLGASHIASYNTIEQETLRQLEADSTFRLKLRKQFLTLLNQLENQG